MPATDQGELFLKLGEVDRTKSNAQKLGLLWPDGCDELNALSLAEAESTLWRPSLNTHDAELPHQNQHSGKLGMA